MADKLGLGTGVHELKIGQSFFNASNASTSGPPQRGRTGPGNRGRPGSSGASAGAGSSLPSYHTIRYDFKPASSSTSSSGYLSVDPETQGVKVTVPHENGDSQTVFGGHQKKANEKECIMVIDHVTGEVTLEMLSSQILVKKTRAEKPERAIHQQNFIQQRQQQKQQQQLSSAPHHSNPPPPPPPDKPAGKHRVGTSRPITPMERSQSPAASSLGRAHESMHHPPSHSQKKQKPPHSQAAAPPPTQQQPQQQPPPPGPSKQKVNQQLANKYTQELSSASSGSDSSSSDSDSDDSDDDDEPSTASKTQSSSTSSMPSFGASGGAGSMPSFGASGAGGGASMPDFLGGGVGSLGSAEPPTNNRRPSESGKPFQSNSIGRPNPPPPAVSAPPTMSMPAVLGNDLQLSESDSD